MALIDCPECDAKVSSAATACPFCGSPIAPVAPAPFPVDLYAARTPPKGLSVAGMACGVGGLVMMLAPCLWLAAIVPDVLGVVLSAVALNKVGRGEQQGRGMAVAGLVCGLVGTVLYVVSWVAFQDAALEVFEALE